MEWYLRLSFKYLFRVLEEESASGERYLLMVFAL